MDYNSEFCNACANGWLRVAKQLVELYPQINISADHDYAFRGACIYGHIEVAKWLVESYPQINISAYYNDAFRGACTYAHALRGSYGHLNVAKWLIDIRPFHYMIKLDPSQTRILSWKIRSIQEVKWLERAVPVLAYNSKTPNIFQMLNYDIMRYICEFV